MSSMQPDDWTLLARCRGMEDELFPEGRDQKRARAVCMGCPVRATCLAEALDNRIEWGVWGGMTERERRQLLRQRPDVQSWAAVLADQDEDLRQQPGILARPHVVRRGQEEPTPIRREEPEERRAGGA